MQWPRQSINQGLHSQKTPHISPSRVSYGVFIADILEIIGRVITTPHCILMNIAIGNGLSPVLSQIIALTIPGILKIGPLRETWFDIFNHNTKTFAILTYWGRDEIVAIFQTTFSNGFF